jgi:hypothetical protein
MVRPGSEAGPTITSTYRRPQEVPVTFRLILMFLLVLVIVLAVLAVAPPRS